jgi:DNA-binding NarL/FixJ family response regulator
MSVENTNCCPLTPALLEVLQTAVHLRTTHTGRLATALNRAPNTIRSEYYRICQILSTHSRSEAVLVALANGWIIQ